MASEANSPEPPGEPLARHIGTVIHLSLERLSALDDEELQSFDCERLRDWWRNRLRGLGLAADDMEAALDRVEQSVRNVLADEQGRWLLSSRRENARSEYALSCLRSDGRLAEHIIDRTYIEDNVRWVVDYKSSVPDSGQSLEEFLQREADSYRAQLEIYRELMSGVDSREVRTALYFTAIPHWLELR